MQNLTTFPTCLFLFETIKNSEAELNFVPLSDSSFAVVKTIGFIFIRGKSYSKACWEARKNIHGNCHRVGVGAESVEGMLKSNDRMKLKLCEKFRWKKHLHEIIMIREMADILDIIKSTWNRLRPGYKVKFTYSLYILRIHLRNLNKYFADIFPDLSFVTSLSSNNS